MIVYSGSCCQKLLTFDKAEAGPGHRDCQQGCERPRAQAVHTMSTKHVLM